MKRLLIATVLVLLISMIVTSCTSTLPRRFTTFVQKMELNYDSYTDKDWQKAKYEFKSLYDEYKEARPKLDDEQKKEINAAIIKYLTICAKKNVSSAVEFVKTASEEIPEVIAAIKPVLLALGLLVL